MTNIFTFDLDFSQYIDWRLPENRIEAFKRVAITRMLEGDLDHWHSSNVISSEMSLNNDQKMLYALLFGQSYRNHWAMIVMQQFPDLLNVETREIRLWHDENWKRAYYAKDTKWGLRKFPDFIESIKIATKGESLYDFIKNICNVGSTKDNFYSLNTALRNLYGIGRMTGWLIQQTIYEFFRFDINYWDLQLYDDTWSQYDSLCYLYNREDLSTKSSTKDVKMMERYFQELMEFCNDDILLLDVYNIESCLCEFRKTCGASGRMPKEFTFWTTNELAEQYLQLRNSWPEVNWKPYVAALLTKGDSVTDFSLNFDYFTVMTNYGLNLNTHIYYKDEPNAHELLSLSKIKTESMKALENDWNNMFTFNERKELKKKYDPKKYLIFRDKNGFFVNN